MKKLSPAIIEIVIDNKNNEIYACIYDFITDYSHRSAGTSYGIENFNKHTPYSEIFESLEVDYNISHSKLLFDVYG